MRLPRVRFTVRQMIILVILLALGLGGTRWAMEMQELATRYRRLSVGYGISEYLCSNPAYGPPDPVERDKLVRHIAVLRGKYDYAARHPWLQVDPDPPEPIEATKWGIKVSIDPDEDGAPAFDGYPNHPPRF
jgi:hypothetical protein